MKRWLENWRARKSLRSQCGHFGRWPEGPCVKKATHYVRNLAGTKLWYCDDHGAAMFFAIGAAKAALRRGERPDIQELARMAARIAGDTSRSFGPADD